MFKNYLKVAFRNFRRNKTFTFINILGLAIGIASSLLIFLFVKSETSYDRFHADAGNIYRVVKDFVNDDGSLIPDATTPSPLAPAMQQEIPEVVSITRLRPNWGRSYLVKYGDKKLAEERVYGVDSSFFDVFSFPLIKGNKKTVFENPNSIVLTETTANRYFGAEDPVGKTIHVDAFGEVMVTGVVRDVPSASHFHFDFLVPYRKQPGVERQLTNWSGYNEYTYVRVKPGTNISGLVKKIQALNDRNVEKSFSVFYVQPLTGIHLGSNLKWELEPNGNRFYVTILSLIAIFILLIAAINYINLATAKAAVRAKEVGVRKVIGAERRVLVQQFLMESMVTCLIAAMLAIILAQLLVPVVEELTSWKFSLFNDPLLLLCFIAGSMLLGLIAGVFPAIYLSSFKPIAVLKGIKISERGTLSLRKTLVVVQFTISIVMIIGGLIVSQQLRFLLSSQLGFDTRQLITIPDAGFLSPAERSAFKTELAKLPGVTAVTSSNGGFPNRFSTSRVNIKGSGKEQQLNFMTVAFNFLSVMNIPVKEGRGFSASFLGDTLTNGIPGGPLEQNIGGLVLNETAVKELGLPSLAIGKQILWSTDKDTSYYLTVVGIAQDFHFASLRNQIKPFGFMVSPQADANVAVRLGGEHMQETLAAMERVWKSFPTERPFAYSFLDERFAKLYAAESLFQKVFLSLVVLGIIIACLGLLGLATFAAQRRVKEIGIRKVLGASVSNVVGLLSVDFLRLVFISLLIAIPIGWYGTSKWLEDFAYRIPVSWWIFPLAGLLAIMIAFFTISFQAVKAAIANPVKSLRTE